MLQAEIREHLIDRLTPIFGKPRDPDFLAAELVKHVPARVIDSDLHRLAERFVVSRKTKSFPLASELIEAVRVLAPMGRAESTGIPGEITAEGIIPMVWIFEEDPRWAELCKRAPDLEPRDKDGRKARPYAMVSKYAPGVGRWFRVEHVQGFPLSPAERDFVASLYANQKPEPIQAAAE